MSISLTRGLTRCIGTLAALFTASIANAQPAPTPTGACCITTTTGARVCLMTTELQCQQQGGTYRGNGTPCTAAACPQPTPTGACCVRTSTGGVECVVLTAEQCAKREGVFRGNGTACTATSCPQPAPRGACCLPPGPIATPGIAPSPCVILTEAQCIERGGTYRGNGTTCATAPCPRPIVRGACCVTNPAGERVCVELTPAQCAQMNGRFRGPGTLCANTNCTPNCPCDFNHDGVVNEADLTAFSAAFAAGQADLNGDGTTDEDDFAIFVRCYFEGCN